MTKQSLFLILISAIFFCSSCSQPCTLTPASAPELRGFRLGMTLDEIKRKYPKLPPIGVSEFGVSKIYFDRMPKVEQSSGEYTFVNADFMDEFKGTRRVYLQVIDNRVAAVKVVYTNEITWKSDDEFIKKTSESLKLPGTWTRQTDYQSLQCRDGLLFDAGIRRDLSYINSSSGEKFPSIEMYNILAQMDETLKKHQKQQNSNQQKEAQKNIFTP